MAALADDGIPGGPGIYSTRCPPLPRLRMKESRDVVHRATLKARGIDPDAAAPGSRKGSRPNSKSGSRKGTPGEASNMADLFGDLDMDPLPKLNRLGGGGGGDFSSGVGADRYLKVSYEAKKMRETRKRELAKAGFTGNGGHGSPGKPPERVEKLKVDYTAQLEQSEEEAERKQPIYLQIANRLREGNLELKQGVESLKDVIKDVQADHDSCKEYERAALEAQKKGSEALEWIQQRYIAKVEGWRAELDKTRKERESLAEDVKNERAEDRDFKRRQEQAAVEKAAKNKSMKRIAMGMLHEVEEKEMQEEVSRGALSQLAITVGLDNPESCTPDEIVAALNKSRDSKDKFAQQISDLQDKEAELWKSIMREKDSLQQARLGLSKAMQARMSQVGGPRMSMSQPTPRMSRAGSSAGGDEDGGGGALALRSSRMSEAEVDLATTRESYMDELLLGREKVLMSQFRNYNNAMIVLATFDEGLRSINDMVDTVVEAPKKRKAAAKSAAAKAPPPPRDSTASAGGGGSDKAVPGRQSSSIARDSTSETFNRKTRNSVSIASSTGALGSPRASDSNLAEAGKAGGVSFADDVGGGGGMSSTQEEAVDITPLTMLFSNGSDGGDGGGGGRRDMMDHYVRLPDLVEATLTRLLDIMKHVPTEGRKARVSVTLGAGPSVAKGGKGIAIDHPLAGVGHKLGKVGSAMSEVEEDPAGLKNKKGREYTEQVKKWCYEAGPPVESEDEDEDAAGNDGGLGGGLGSLGRVNAKLSTVSQFKRIGTRNRNADPDAPMQVVKRGDLKLESNRAQAKVEKAKAPFAAPPAADSPSPAKE